MHETCENQLDHVNSYVCYTYQALEIYQVLLYSVDFKVTEGIRNSMSKTMPSKCSLIWKK